jgi:heat shock protein HslJ
MDLGWIVFLCGCATSNEPSGIPAPLELDGSHWAVTEYRADDGGLVSVLPESEVTVAFDAGARITGSAGCNAYFASYTLDSEGLRFGAPGATRRFCGEPSGLMDQEFRFLALLEQVAGMRLAGGTLRLLSDSGEPLVMLVPTTQFLPGS